MSDQEDFEDDNITDASDISDDDINHLGFGVIDDDIDENKEDDEDDELDLDIDDDDNVLNMSQKHTVEIISNTETYKNMLSKPKKTKPYMSKFEFTKLLGIRSQQLSSGMPSTVQNISNFIHTKNIALQEIKEKKIPLIIRRTLPDGQTEDWKADELILPVTIYNS